MPIVAALMPGADASTALRRTLPGGGSWTLLGCRSTPQLARALESRLVDAVVFSPIRTPLPEIAPLRRRFPHVPWIGFAPFKPDDGALLLACHADTVGLILVDGVDNAVAGELVVRYSAAAERAGALSDAVRILRLSDPLQRAVWHYLLDRVDQTVRTVEIARTLGCSREHLSRQFGAGGAPNLKRVIDLTRIACAASLLRNPGYDAASVARILRFATASHLSATARRIAGVPTRGLAPLGPRGVLLSFARGKTRSRI
jgi:AraC-like DNA-binding protein